MTKNFLYFLPAQDEGGQKKTFFFFEYLHDGALNSDLLPDTDKAVSLIKNALTESTRNIVVDTSTNSGRNLLNRVITAMETKEQTKRICLASLYWQHYEEIHEYRDAYDMFSPDKPRLPTDEHFVKLFHSVRTLGGMRPLTKWDEIALTAWFDREPNDEMAKKILTHPIARLLLAVAEESVGGGDLPNPHATRKIITRMLCCLFKLLQDPFPIEQDREYVYDTPYTRLFKKLPPPKEGQLLPQNFISYVCYDRRIETDDNDKPLPESLKQDAQRKASSEEVKKKYPLLWELLTCCAQFLKSLGPGNMPLDACCVFAGGHDVPDKIKNLLNAMLYIWMEVMVPAYVEDTDTLHFFNPTIFVNTKINVMAAHCKRIVQQCLEENTGQAAV